MLKYDLLVLNLSVTEFMLALLKGRPNFIHYFVKETDLNFLEGRLEQKTIDIDRQLQELDSLMREKEDKWY